MIYIHLHTFPDRLLKTGDWRLTNLRFFLTGVFPFIIKLCHLHRFFDRVGVTPFPSSISFTLALKSTFSPSFTFVFSHLTLSNFLPFFSSFFSLSYACVSSECIILGIIVIGAIILLLSFTPMWLHVVTVLPTTAASLPFIRTFPALTPLTYPLLSGGYFCFTKTALLRSSLFAPPSSLRCSGQPLRIPWPCRLAWEEGLFL